MQIKRWTIAVLMAALAAASTGCKDTGPVMPLDPPSGDTTTTPTPPTTPPPAGNRSHTEVFDVSNNILQLTPKASSRMIDTKNNDAVVSFTGLSLGLAGTHNGYTPVAGQNLTRSSASEGLKIDLGVALANHGDGNYALTGTNGDGRWLAQGLIIDSLSADAKANCFLNGKDIIVHKSGTKIAACKSGAVTTPPVIAISLDKAAATITKGDSVCFVPNITGTENKAFTVRSSNPNVVTARANGCLIAKNTGEADVTYLAAADTTVKAKLDVTVVAAGNQPTVTQVVVTPNAPSVQVGNTVQLSAVSKDASGNTLAGRTHTWASLDTAKATVNGSGLVTGKASGSAKVRGCDGSMCDTVTVTVTAPAPVNNTYTRVFTITQDSIFTFTAEASAQEINVDTKQTRATPGLTTYAAGSFNGYAAEAGKQFTRTSTSGGFGINLNILLEKHAVGESFCITARDGANSKWWLNQGRIWLELPQAQRDEHSCGGNDAKVWKVGPRKYSVTKPKS